MSSASNRFLTHDDLIMLDRVLAHANYPQSPDQLKQDARLEATRFLIEAFQKGMTNQVTLRALLSDRQIIEAPIETMGQKLGEKLCSERFQTNVPSTYPGGGHQFGKMVERDGKWTVHHVFTGVPAQFGKWWSSLQSNGPFSISMCRPSTIHLYTGTAITPTSAH